MGLCVNSPNLPVRQSYLYIILISVRPKLRPTSTFFCNFLYFQLQLPRQTHISHNTMPKPPIAVLKSQWLQIIFFRYIFQTAFVTALCLRTIKSHCPTAFRTKITPVWNIFVGFREYLIYHLKVLTMLHFKFTHFFNSANWIFHNKPTHSHIQLVGKISQKSINVTLLQVIYVIFL